MGILAWLFMNKLSPPPLPKQRVKVKDKQTNREELIWGQTE